MSEENMESETVTVKTFTQDELDKIVADRLSREQRKFDKLTSGIDLDEAREAIDEKAAAGVESQKARGEFELILKQTVEASNLKISTLESKLQSTLVDGALLSAASSNNAVSPTQVSTLLKHLVRLAEDGTVEVTDGKVARYNNKGDLLSVNEAVSEFLTANPHFVRATPGGTGSQGHAGSNNDIAGKTKSREEFEQLNPLKRKEFIRSGGTLD